jgi:hypothetical protein
MTISVAMILASVAQVQEGRLVVVGGGWSVRDPEPEGAAGIGVVLYVPREMLGKTISTRLVLEDAASGEEIAVVPLKEDGEPMGDPGGIEIHGDIEAVGLNDPTLTTPLVVPLTVTLPPFRLPPGQEFRWQLYLDGETRPEWALAFRTTPPAPE